MVYAYKLEDNPEEKKRLLNHLIQLKELNLLKLKAEIKILKHEFERI